MTNNYYNVRTAAAVLGESQLKFRIGLARQRTQTYPLDSMDFIMMDLERPDGCRRFADFCTGDLTGRLLEFVSCSDGIDGKSDPRLSELFERILKQRQTMSTKIRETAALLPRGAPGCRDSTRRPPDRCAMPRW